ncbi:MAG: histidine--tRNA ligase [Truepera sp.]|jgi:histidyl-tRNA synthetase|nr:histidine--tRNA ligase [Truepera sp.]
MKLQAVKGTQDILPRDQAAWHAITAAAEQVLGGAGAGKITPPIFEFTEVFEKSVGESADLMVQKEMYTFEDRGGRSLTLRPEFTAGLMRSFIEHGMHTLPQPVKLWAEGPLFRAENVQRGRYRQFHQVDYELVGSDSALADAEAIELLYRTLQACGLTRHRIRLGSVGDPDDRAAYNAYLREELAPHAERLSPVSQERLRLNPLRVLDSKDQGDQALIADLQRPLERLGPAARGHLAEVEHYLRSWDVPFDLDPAIVRGLDYYRRTAFEVHYEGIGAQSALGGGGRYDGLIELLGGPPIPATGWAFGVERVLDALAQEEAAQAETPERPALFVIPLDDEAVGEGADLATRLRREALRVEFAYQRRNPGKGLRDADRSGARFAALRGAEERTRGTWQLKDLASGEQSEVADEALRAALTERLENL